VISNVVEIPLFNERDTLSVTRKFRFIHISTMMFQKNPEGLLRVFKIFNCLYPNTFLQLVGPFPEHLPSYAKSIGLTENEIEFKGPVSYLEVAALLKSANSLVLFSRYENLPCVILEAFCCGLPVISTRVGGIAEVVNETNGILIDSENEDQLLEAFKHIYLNYKQYNSKIIADAAKQSFSYEAVGKEINEVYTKLVSV
jgi:glycosyltransferase involved in cell wall biosynthesis